MGGGKPPAPGELLSQMRDAGDKAVHEFLVSARDKAETLGNRPRRRSMGSVERKSRVRSMTEEEFREAEAAAAAMELKLTALGEEEKGGTRGVVVDGVRVVFVGVGRGEDSSRGRRAASTRVGGGIRRARVVARGWRARFCGARARRLAS